MPILGAIRYAVSYDLGMIDARIWLGERPKRAPGGTLVHGVTGRSVTHDVYVLDPANFDRAEQAIALCLAHGLLPPANGRVN